MEIISNAFLGFAGFVCVVAAGVAIRIGWGLAVLLLPGLKEAPVHQTFSGDVVMRNGGATKGEQR